MVKIEQKDFIGAAPVMRCQNSSWIRAWGSMEKGEPRFPNILRKFLNLQKKYEKLYTKQTSTAEFLSKIPYIKKYLMDTLIFVRRKYILVKSWNLDEIIKFWNKW